MLETAANIAAKIWRTGVTKQQTDGLSQQSLKQYIMKLFVNVNFHNFMSTMRDRPLKI